MFAIIIKAAVFLAGLIGVAAQAKARGASTAETIAETATAAAGATGLLQMNPLRMGKKPTP
jgi:hypothetical protein